MKGIDVSSFQDIVPWHTLPDISFGIIKVTEGEGYVSPHWMDNAINLHVENKLRGFYLFSRPGLSNNTPEGEAAYFWSKVERIIKHGDIIAADIEKTEYTSPPRTSDWAYRLLSHLEHIAGYKPLIYSYPDFIKNNLKDKRLAKYPLWLAWYKKTLPSSFAQWDKIALWQQGPGKVNGIAGQTDIDVFFLNADKLKEYGKP